MTADYALLEIPHITDYLAERGLVPELRADGAPLRCEEVSDGNLNRVFLARHEHGRPGVALKQALPWVRVHGESWPLTPQRAVSEARAYEVYQRFAEEFVPKLYDFHAERFIMAMEDLGTLRVWREVLNEGVIDSSVSAAIGTFVARIGFHTSDFGMVAEDRKELAATSINPALCRITEDVVLREPYIEHEHNHYLPSLAPVVEELRHDGVLRAAVADLRHIFMTHGEALVHGDLHSGSIMVGDGRVVVIDPEFAFYGPLGFDLGVFWGNCIIAAVRAHLLGAPADALRQVDELIETSWEAFLAEWARLWPTRTDTFFDDDYLPVYLRQVWSDGLGFAGTEAMRRVIGYAHASDLTTMPEPEQEQAARAVVRICRQLIIRREELVQPRDVAGLVTQEIRRIVETKAASLTV